MAQYYMLLIQKNGVQGLLSCLQKWYSILPHLQATPALPRRSHHGQDKQDAHLQLI